MNNSIKMENIWLPLPETHIYECYKWLAIHSLRVIKYKSSFIYLYKSFISKLLMCKNVLKNAHTSIVPILITHENFIPSILQPLHVDFSV